MKIIDPACAGRAAGILRRARRRSSRRRQQPTLLQRQPGMLAMLAMAHAGALIEFSQPRNVGRPRLVGGHGGVDRIGNHDIGVRCQL